MGFLEVLAVIAAILSGIFFIAAIIWALKSFRDKEIDESVRHIDTSNSPGGTFRREDNHSYGHQESSTSHPTDYPEQGHYGSHSEDYAYPQFYSDLIEEEIPPGKMPGIAAASDMDDISTQEFYKIEGYEYEEDPEDVEVAWDKVTDKKDLPQVISADGKTPKVEKRERPQKRVLPESTRCNICLGYIKTGLPLITCICGKSYHISCGSRIEECPMCHHDLLDYEDLTLDTSTNGGKDPAKTEENIDEYDKELSEKGAFEVSEEIAVTREDDPDVSTDILDKEQMERLTRLLKRYNLDEELSKRASMRVLRGK